MSKPKHDGPSLSAVRDDFIEKTGLVTQAEGLPRIAGRIFGMLVFDGETVSFSDLATRLQVSRASISSSIRILEERGLVRRVSKPGERQDFFALAPTPYATMLERIQSKHRAISRDIAATIDALPEHSAAIGRLTDHANFYKSLDAAVEVAIAGLQPTCTPTNNDTAGQSPDAAKDDPNDA